MAKKGAATHYKNPPEQVIMWDGLELGWTIEDLEKLRKMWSKDIPMEEIVQALRPQLDGDWEVFLAIAYQLCRGYIEGREKHIILGGV